MFRTKRRLGLALTASLASLTLTHSFLPAAFAKYSAIVQSTDKSYSAAKEHNNQKEEAESNNSPIMRLTKDVMPESYDLTVEPDLKNFTFTGSESIIITVAKPCHHIFLNSNELKVSEAKLTNFDGGDKSDAEGQSITVSKIIPDDNTERLKLVLKTEIAAGTYKLFCKFSGKLNGKLEGFYRSSFQDKNHIKHWLCATQMEPTNCRRMFPCFDEPEFKATFKIKAIIPANFVAISNSPVASEEELKNKKVVTFEATPKMSSYLVALVIGEFKSTGEITVADMPLKVWAVDGKEHLGQYALDQAAKALAFEKEYFGLPYPNKKLDLIAIPDFEAGGMENLGAITFNDSLLLADEKRNSLSTKKDITSVIAHEIAHQWFGDLVTMRWWDALWLNEAFATWMATKASDALHPEWRVITETVAARGGMSTDSLRTTRAIHADVTKAGQIDEMFDNITYDKGESVLRMLEAFVGKEVFQKGVHKYLYDHSFSNASTEDLWNAIAACAPTVPVAQIMKTFIYQPGVPLVTVSLKEDGHSILASQKRFFPLDDDKNDKLQWLIPIAIRPLGQVVEETNKGEAQTKDKKHVAKILSTKEALMRLPKNWPAIVVNASGMGYYHTCYSTALLKKLQDNFESLTVEEKLIIMSDANALTLSGKVPIEDIYNFALHLPQENDPLVLAEFVRYYSTAHTYMTGSAKQPYEKLVRERIGPLKRQLGWSEQPGEKEDQKQLRSAALTLLGTYGQDAETIKEASEKLTEYETDHKSVSPNIMETLLNIVTFNGGTKQYDEIIALYKKAQNPEDRDRALSSLSGFRDKQLTRRTIAFAMSKDVRLLDGLDLLIAVAAKRESRAVGWPYIEAHWAEIMRKYPQDSLRSLPHAASNVHSRKEESEVRTWFATHPMENCQSAVARMEEGMSLQLLRQERLGERIKKWMLAQAAEVAQTAPVK